jgi:hypothetical protein
LGRGRTMLTTVFFLSRVPRPQNPRSTQTAHVGQVGRRIFRERTWYALTCECTPGLRPKQSNKIGPLSFLRREFTLHTHQSRIPDSKLR